MKYIVMECHLSYAVVLDENGRFLKVANRNYEVGQTVTEVIEMQIPQSVPQKKKNNKWMYSLAAMAACLMLLITSVFQIKQMPYASVYMTINPEVRIDVNRNDMVVGLTGVNTDGEALIESYSFKKKHLDLVMDELVDRAIDRGYLHEGGQISLVLDADNDEWIIIHSDTLTTHLNEHLNKKLSVTIEVSDKNMETNQVIIPVTPKESNYGESDYSEDQTTTPPPVSTEPSDSSYDDSGYEDNSYNDSSYDDNNYDDSSDNDSSYEDGSYSDSSYEDGSYSDSGYEDGNYSDSSYEDGSYSDSGYEDEQSDYDDD